MITLQQSVGTNNQTIWVLKINTETPVYLSTKAITLGSAFDGQVLNYDNYLSELSYMSTIEQSGGVGSVTSMGFSVSRYVDNSAFNGFFNEFYLATSGVYLSGVEVQYGICWEGATTDTEITWLFNGRIVDYNYEQRRLNVNLFQSSEITNKEVPYYEIQKDFDNEISYFPSADKEIYGDIIPIVYGSFNSWQPTPKHEDVSVSGSNESVNLRLTPAIITNKSTLEILVCSHKIKTTNFNPSSYFGAAQNNTFKYLSGLDTYMHVYQASPSANSNLNTYGSFKYSLLYEKIRMYGRLHIHLNQASDFTGTIDVANAIDDSPTTYTEIDEFADTNTNRVALVPKGSESTSEVGYLGQSSDNIKGVFAVVSDDGGSRNYRIGIRNASDSTALYSETSTTAISGTTITHEYADFSGDTTAKNDANLPYTIEELCGYDWYVINHSGSADQLIRVFYGYIEINNINVTGQIFKNKGFGSVKTPNIRGVNIRFRIPGLHT